jgi:protein involved in polysaccharide export with SLBB domain
MAQILPRLLRALTILVVAGLAGAPALAAGLDTAALLRMKTGRQSSGEAPALSIVDSVFFLSPGDQLQLRWWGISTGDERLSVNTRWEIVVPDIGKINVRGVRFDHVRDSLENMIRHRSQVRLVDLQITRVSRASVQVTGLVPRPGALDLSPGTRLSDALEEAGLSMQDIMHSIAGNTPPRPGERYRMPSVRRILLIRGGGSDSVWCDLAQAYNAGVTENNPPLFQGDRIEVLPQGALIALSGSAPMAGYIEVVPGETVAQFLRAGGVTSPPSEIRAVFVDGRQTTLHSGSILDTTLSLVEAPIQRHRPLPQFVWVAGLVRNPGGYILEPGMTAKDLVRKAGGIPGGDDSGYVLALKRGWMWIRPGHRPGLEGSTQYPEVRAALQGYLNQGRGYYSSIETPLQPGDSVLVQIVEQVVWVSGQVNNPGYVPWVRGATMDDYVKAAGGYSARPWPSHARLYNLFTDQVIPVDGEIPPSTAIIVPEKRYIYPDQWVTIVATIVGLAVSVASFYIMATSSN